MSQLWKFPLSADCVLEISASATISAVAIDGDGVSMWVHMAADRAKVKRRFAVFERRSDVPVGKGYVFVATAATRCRERTLHVFEVGLSDSARAFNV